MLWSYFATCPCTGTPGQDSGKAQTWFLPRKTTASERIYPLHEGVVKYCRGYLRQDKANPRHLPGSHWAAAKPAYWLGSPSADDRSAVATGTSISAERRPVISGLSTSLGAPLTISPSHLFRSTDETSKAGPIWSEYEQVGIDPFHQKFATQPARCYSIAMNKRPTDRTQQGQQDH